MPGNGAGGRPRKPTPLRVLEGNAGHRAIPEDVPLEPMSDDLSPPKWLKAKAAIDTWNEFTPIWHRAGILTEDNRLIIAHLADAQARYLRARTGANMRDVKQLLEQLGATPASRSKVAAVGVRKPDDVWAKLDSMGV